MIVVHAMPAGCGECPRFVGVFRDIEHFRYELSERSLHFSGEIRDTKFQGTKTDSKGLTIRWEFDCPELDYVYECRELEIGFADDAPA